MYIYRNIILVIDETPPGKTFRKRETLSELTARRLLTEAANNEYGSGQWQEIRIPQDGLTEKESNSLLQDIRRSLIETTTIIILSQNCQMLCILLGGFIEKLPDRMFGKKLKVRVAEIKEGKIEYHK